MTSRILIVDDEANIRRMLGALLKSEGFEVSEAANGNSALLTLDEAPPDAILIDLMMPGPDGIQTLEKIRERDSATPVIMMSGKAQLTDAVRAIKLGAFQFLEKPLTPEAVLVTLRSALELTRTQAENRALKSQLRRPRVELVGTTPEMQRVREAIARVGPTEARVLIYGESGTGKELVAHAIHQASRRASKPIVSVNCAAIPRDLVESEMFGHERGAFTGATERRLGRFELADGGTLFLDEVGDMTLKTQAKVLRALQEQRVEPVGGSVTVTVDVRVIAATNKDLEEEIRKGTFREDLFFRLNVIPFHVPPLRDRAEDVPRLARHFMSEISAEYGRRPKEFSPGAMELLRAHKWPGNVRELRNIVERLMIMTPGERVDAHHLPASLLGGAAGPSAGPAPAEQDFPSLADAREDFEKRYITRTYKECGGNMSRLAETLQVERSNLYRKMKGYGLLPMRKGEPVEEGA